jgi:mRNA interferase MazF
MTRTIRQIPTEVLVGPEDGLPVPCAVRADDLLTVPMRRLSSRITELSQAKMRAVAEAVRFALAL